MNGWIKIDRDITSHWLFEDSWKFKKRLRLKANYLSVNVAKLYDQFRHLQRDGDVQNQKPGGF